MSKSAQKFVGRNRAPRVQIEYDVELYGAEKTVQLPFVMGVMSDLSGKSETPLPAVADRKFLEIDVDNFDDRMKAMAPRAAFVVPNTLTGEGNLSVDLTFEQMEDFSPAAVAKKVAPLRALLDARTQLAHLTTYMDGKTGAEGLIADLMSDPASFAALTGTAEDAPADQNAALEALRQSAPAEIPEAEDETTRALDALRSQPVEAVQTDETDVALADLLQAASTDVAREEAQDEIAAPEEIAPETEAVLADMPEAAEDGALLDGDALSDESDDDLLTELVETIEAEGEEDDTLLDDDADEALSDDSDDDILAELAETTEDEGEDADTPEADIDTAEDLPDLDEGAEETATTPIAAPFGTLSAERPTDDQTAQKFRIAIMGDFSGRGSRGALETGAALARRKPIKFDIDTLDDVIARFATTLVLPIGTDGAGVEVKLTELDDLHPDQLFENVEVFAELSALRQRVAMGDGAAAIADMQGWGDEFGRLNLTARNRAKGTTVPADRTLSAFQTLIGDMQGQLATPSPTSDLIARIVGPFVQAAPDPAQPSMIAAIDEALSGAMRAILHHPDFQAVEATWRSLELLARRIETGAKLDVVLYDVSAEEWAADLSAQDDLAQSGLFQMLGAAPRLDAAQGPLSAVFGLYTLEETPPHAELLARMAKISEWMHAPFMAAMSPKFLETPKHERHPLTAQNWDALGALPEAAYIGLAAPRFLLRLPYGAKTEPVDPFDFEEFNLREGLKGMLWANPVVLSAILMAQTINTHGDGKALGKILSLDDVPLHYMTDQYGDQIALPCTERLLNTTTTAEVTTRGFIPLLSMKGRPEVRQGAFQALSGTILAGPWGARGAVAAPAAENEADVSLGAATSAEGTSDEDAADDILAALDADDLPDLDGAEDDDDTDTDAELAALLAGFEDGGDDTDDDDDDDEDDDDEELDPELAALLEGL